MTGFARSEGAAEGHAFAFEVKSVNGRSLDIRCRVPGGFDSVEALARTEAGRRFKRGSITIGLQLGRAAAAAPIRINRALLDQLRELAREIDGPDAPPLRAEALLNLRGVIETAEDEGLDAEARGRLQSALAAALAEGLDALAAARLAEGAQLAAVLEGQLAQIEALTAEAAGHASLRPEAAKARLREMLHSLLDAVPALPEERLAQEAALLVGKADVREELDRLRAHVASARAMLAEGGAIGRKLDFLCQEFNREANTLCSKANDLDVTRIGLALKAVIEQFREQVQNIE